MSLLNVTVCKLHLLATIAHQNDLSPPHPPPGRVWGGKRMVVSVLIPDFRVKTCNIKSWEWPGGEAIYTLLHPSSGFKIFCNICSRLFIVQTRKAEWRGYLVLSGSMLCTCSNHCCVSRAATCTSHCVYYTLDKWGLYGLIPDPQSHSQLST